MSIDPNQEMRKPVKGRNTSGPTKKSAKPPCTTAEASCQKCGEPETGSMVQCDNCDLWFHFTCVGVTNEIQDIDWNCQNCIEKHNTTRDQHPANDVSKARSIISCSSNASPRRIEIELQRLNEERKLLEKRDKEYLDKKYKLLLAEDERTVGEESANQLPNMERVRQWIRRDVRANTQQDLSDRLKESREFVKDNPYPPIPDSLAAVHNASPIAAASLKRTTANGTYHPPATVLQNNISKVTQMSQLNLASDLPTNNNALHTLSAQQLASRHVMPKELPNFNGHPNEWPLFIATYESSTRTCGFSNEENLIRLQRCLKGQALESVRGRLMQPSSVPDIIKTLRMLYGRPELIIHTLLQKLRQEPPPKAEKLETIIKFALSVQNMCATMEVSGLAAHLCNPTLLQELTDKLPASIKLNWAIYKQTVPTVTISTFSSWLLQIAEAASDVTLASVVTEKRSFNGKGFINTHVEDQENDVARKRQSKICRICQGNCSAVKNCNKFQNLSHSQKWLIVREHKLCRICLFPHGRNRCKVNTLCGINNCTRRHHRSLHNDDPKSEWGSKAVTEFSTVNQHCNAHQELSQPTLFRIVPLILHKDNVSVNTYAFLDDGSSLTLMEDQLANELGLEGVYEPLCLKWTADTHRMENDSRRVSLRISNINNPEKKYRISNIRTVKSLNLPRQSVSTKSLASKFPHLKGIPIEPYQNAVPRILIGLDNWNLSLPLKSRQGKYNQPIASKTRLGWTVYGTCNDKVDKSLPDQQCHSFHICECKCDVDSDLHDLVKNYFSIERIGVASSSQLNILSKDDQRAIDILKSTTVRKGLRFETGLLWKYDQVKFPDSYAMALRRLCCLEKRMAQDPELAGVLQQRIQDHISKGYIRKLSNEELKRDYPRIWYLPIFPVINPNKPGKVRLVWDAAAKVNGISLNSMLLKGPDQLASLIAVLYRFRERQIAVCADIKEMFHQVQIREEDQHSQRFLWRSNNSKQELEVYVMKVMTFGATCSPSCAQYVKNKNALSFSVEFPRAVLSITENHYVDDLLDSVDTEAEAIKLAHDVKYIHAQGGFEIRNWISNSSNVTKSIGEIPASDKRNLNMNPEDGAEKVLGMWWCTSTDTFTYCITYTDKNRDVLKGKRPPTKREVLRILMTIYDPLGLLAHFLIYVKILLQEIWRSAIDWDESINDAQYIKWLRWIHVLQDIEKLRIPRSYLQNTCFRNEKQIQLHIFVDASENAYASVAYLRVENDNGEVECSLVAAKTRVAPLKMLSIPRLELEAALLGTRLAKSIQKGHSISISSRFFWTDSKTVLCWLNSDHRKYRQFVAFRVGEILESSDIFEWRWIPSKLNVADEATKWQKIPELNAGSRWFQGPEFLRYCAEMWPRNITEIQTTSEEIRPHMVHTSIPVRNLIEARRFSNWIRLVRTQAFVLRFVHNLFSRIKNNPKRLGPLLQEEYFQAENRLYRQAQLEHYLDEMTILENNKGLPIEKRKILDKRSPIYKQSPYLDSEGVLRIRGRIDAAVGISMNTKRPVLLPKDHHITLLIIKWYHSKYHHHNYETIINELRQVYSIPNLRSAVKRERRLCQLCKNRDVCPNPPEMAELPPARLSSFVRPFSYIGIDYFGPIKVTIGRRAEKRWGVLITCLTIRAVHIEVASTLSTDSCILSLRKFIARRGLPVEIYSDNGTNFRGADRELREACKQINLNELAEKFTSSTTKWNFIPPASPHMGGSWERLVRSVKKTLNQIMPTRYPSDELLYGMLLEVESTINSRPLTYVPIDSDSDEALTPNHFLLGSSNGAKPIGEFNDDGVLLKRSWTIAQQFSNSFWKRWIREYLPVLTRRTKWFQPVKPIEKGDIVIIVDENSPRNCWPKGKVLETIMGKDGQVRQFQVYAKEKRLS